MRLDGKVALITGAASGIGRCCAQVFAREGAHVVIADINYERAEETARFIGDNKGSKGSAVAVRLDVTQSSDFEECIATVFKRFGRVDILHNNAGIAAALMPLENVEEEFFDKLMAVNIKGVFFGCRHIIPLMKKQGGGVILNTASIDGFKGRPGSHIYAASKGAVIAMTKALAVELAPFNIRINCVNPVITDTPMLNSFLTLGESIDESRKKLLSAIPLGRWASVGDVANAALYLVSEEASFLTGAEINVNGGYAV